MFTIPQEFRHWTLLIVFGNSLLTYLFEKVVVYYISVWNQNRQERKRKALINSDVT